MTSDNTIEFKLTLDAEEVGATIEVNEKLFQQLAKEVGQVNEAINGSLNPDNTAAQAYAGQSEKVDQLTNALKEGTAAKMAHSTALKDGVNTTLNVVSSVSSFVEKSDSATESQKKFAESVSDGITAYGIATTAVEGLALAMGTTVSSGLVAAIGAVAGIGVLLSDMLSGNTEKINKMKENLVGLNSAIENVNKLKNPFDSLTFNIDPNKLEKGIKNLKDNFEDIITTTSFAWQIPEDDLKNGLGNISKLFEKSADERSIILEKYKNDLKSHYESIIRGEKGFGSTISDVDVAKAKGALQGLDDFVQRLAGRLGTIEKYKKMLVEINDYRIATGSAAAAGYTPETKSIKTSEDIVNQKKEGFELNKIKRELNEISLQDYEEFLKKKIAALKGSGLEEKKLALEINKELKNVEYQIKYEQAKGRTISLEPKLPDNFSYIKVPKGNENDKKLREDYNKIKIDSINDQYARENAQIDAWENGMLTKFGSIENAKTEIASEALKKRIILKQKELMENDAFAGVLLSGYKSLSENLLRTDMTGAQKRQAILDSMQNYVFHLLTKELQEFILKNAAELLVHTETEAGKTAATEAGAAARKASLLEDVATTLYDAAASIVNAAASIIEWEIGAFGPFAIATIPASIAAIYGLFTGVKKMLGFAKGGAIVGENGVEIIAPAEDYATGMADLVTRTAFEVRNYFGGAKGDDGSLMNEIKILNARIEALASRPARAYLDNDEAMKVGQHYDYENRMNR
jgi:hypothetical protein